MNEEHHPQSVSHTANSATAASVARTRVLDAAEQLFAAKGYTAVTLRDIAAVVGIRHASLYHHVPGGKEEIFVEVTQRHLQRHRDGLQQALAAAAPNVRARLHAIATWLLSQPPMDLVRLVYSDLPAIAPEHAMRLSFDAYASMLTPIEGVLRQAAAEGEISHPQLGLIAGGILGLIESLFAVPEFAVTGSRPAMAATLIDALLDGIRTRTPTTSTTPLSITPAATDDDSH